MIQIRRGGVTIQCSHRSVATSQPKEVSKMGDLDQQLPLNNSPKPVITSFGQCPCQTQRKQTGSNHTYRCSNMSPFLFRADTFALLRLWLNISPPPQLVDLTSPIYQLWPTRRCLNRSSRSKLVLSVFLLPVFMFGVLESTRSSVNAYTICLLSCCSPWFTGQLCQHEHQYHWLGGWYRNGSDMTVSGQSCWRFWLDLMKFQGPSRYTCVYDHWDLENCHPQVRRMRQRSTW